ncbi:hypothetical protein IIC44_01875 [Patescibacteria group bacterium]|nr:hypothetical protein [Patescibacteria group bacterium]
MEFAAVTLDVVGTLLLGYTVLRVHYRFRKEHQVDEKVFREMRREQHVGIFGLFLIALGYILILPTIL